ncbi:FGGY-family carbohydrate kinase [Hymenobacter nivis]|uniref:Carbohydrate kinase n=1 Tax=Hymenobacter nivis TaxID=1850093 RepID=A0A502H2G0_9BACT|nr:FGGY family carbohydrate kinase [Hymenobacter nivis]TPG67556.1 carbohydrate kinase [Hymenobacter nivis]
MRKPVYAIFDVGKTNKKILLFDESHRLLEEHQHVCLETVDDDGFPCETLERLTHWVLSNWHALRQHPSYLLKGVNFTAYGASFVHLGADGQPVAPLYNYLKPLPERIAAQFYAAVGAPPEEFATATCSPTLGLLNSGLQLYWLKYTRPELFARVHTSLHLPQYLSYLITGEKFSDYTSVGCHTALWDFARHGYHAWVHREGLAAKLAPLLQDPIAAVVDGVLVGAGLHDSSAAVLPYLRRHAAPFLLVSTGTWAVTFNPFNQQPLTTELLRRDCLSYLSPQGQGVLAARVFLGREHDYQVQHIANHFRIKAEFSHEFYKTQVTARPADPAAAPFRPWCMHGTGPYPEQPAQAWDLAGFRTAGDAYQHLMRGLVDILAASIRLVRQDEPTIFLDGGFARNPLFRELLAEAFPGVGLQTLEVPQATALGALLHLEQGVAQQKPANVFT